MHGVKGEISLCQQPLTSLKVRKSEMLRLVLLLALCCAFSLAMPISYPRDCVYVNHETRKIYEMEKLWNPKGGYAVPAVLNGKNVTYYVQGNDDRYIVVFLFSLSLALL